MRRSSQVESQVGSRGDEEISSARSNFFLAAHDDDLSTLEGTHVRTETSNVSSPRSHTNRFSLPSFCKGTEDRECPRPACTLSSFTSSVFGMIETTNAQTTESILDSTWINAQSKHSTACIVPCFLNFRACLCLGDVAMAAAREISPTGSKGCRLRKMLEQPRKRHNANMMNLMPPLKATDQQPFKKSNIIHINQHPPGTVYSGISSWKTLTREALQI